LSYKEIQITQGAKREKTRFFHTGAFVGAMVTVTSRMLYLEKVDIPTEYIL
jgi:hypothetical protein